MGRGARRAALMLALVHGAALANGSDFHVGRVACDFGMAVESVTWYDSEGDSQGVSRNEQALQLRLHTDPDRRWQFVTAVDLVTGTDMPRVELAGDGVEEQNDQWQVRSDAAYIDMQRLGLDGLDVRIGRQVIAWGTADIFNPTDVLSSRSFEDPSKFGQNLPDPAVNVHYQAWGFDLNAIYVQRFQSPRLPAGIEQQFFNSGRIPPEFADLADEFLRNDGNIDLTLLPDVPSRSMWGARLVRNFGGFDASVSYARANEEIPVLRSIDVKVFDPVNFEAAVDADIFFPRKTVYGADVAGQLPFLGHPGVWAEAAWTVPEPATQTITFLGAPLSTSTILDEPYLKYTVGGDYTIRSGYLFQCQIVHGFIDENERALLGNYVVAGFEKSYFTDALRVRLFEAYSASDGGYLVTPDLLWYATDSIEVGLGGIVYGGKSDSKFGGTPSGDQYYLRLRYAF